jgi:hypothetical protein
LLRILPALLAGFCPVGIAHRFLSWQGRLGTQAGTDATVGEKQCEPP